MKLTRNRVEMKQGVELKKTACVADQLVVNNSPPVTSGI